MATQNIYNTATGVSGYQVPGAQLQSGWAWGTAPAKPVASPITAPTAPIITPPATSPNNTSNNQGQTTALTNQSYNMSSLLNDIKSGKISVAGGYNQLSNIVPQANTFSNPDQYNNAQTSARQQYESGLSGLGSFTQPGGGQYHFQNGTLIRDSQANINSVTNPYGTTASTSYQTPSTTSPQGTSTSSTSQMSAEQLASQMGVPLEQAQNALAIMARNNATSGTTNTTPSGTTTGTTNTSTSSQAGTTPDYDKAVQTALQNYLQNITPSSTEQELQAQSDNFDAQLKALNTSQGVMNSNIEDQHIDLPFVTGQEAAVEKRYALKRQDIQNQQQTLQQKLARAQAQRAAAADVYKTQLGVAQSQQTRGYAVSDAATKRQQEVEDAANKPYILPAGDKLVTAGSSPMTSPITDKSSSTDMVNKYNSIIGNNPNPSRVLQTNPPKAVAPKGTNYTANTIPSDVKGQLEIDINKEGITLPVLMSLYPEVSSTYISSLWKTLKGVANPF